MCKWDHCDVACTLQIIPFMEHSYCCATQQTIKHTHTCTHTRTYTNTNTLTVYCAGLQDWKVQWWLSCERSLPQCPSLLTHLTSADISALFPTLKWIGFLDWIQQLNINNCLYNFLSGDTEINTIIKNTSASYTTDSYSRLLIVSNSIWLKYELNVHVWYILKVRTAPTQCCICEHVCN